MSNTSKTDPYWVRVQDGRSHTEPVHDHRFGECDLPETPAVNTGTRCRWAWSCAGGGGNECGCRICTAHHERRIARRRSRHDSKRVLDEIAKDPELAYEVSIPTGDGPFWY